MKPKLAIVIYTNGRDESFVYLSFELHENYAIFTLPNGCVRYVIRENCYRIDTEG